MLIFGSASWHSPHGNNEADMARMANGCAALMGTSDSELTHHPKDHGELGSPPHRSQVPIGVDDVDVEAATELGILVTHGRPNQTGAVSPRA